MDIGKGIQRSFDLFTKNAGVLIPAGIVALLVSLFTFGILTGPVIGGYLLLCLKVMRGEKGEFNEIFAHFDKFIPSLLLTIIVLIPLMIVGLIPILGALAMLVIGPLAGVICLIGLALLFEKNMAPMDAVKEAFKIVTEKNPVMTWVYALACGFLSGLGAIACLVGVLATYPFYFVSMAVAYDELTGSAPVAPSTSIEA